MLAGSQAAHVLAYRWVFPSSQMRLHELLSTGHGYMDRLPMVLGVTGAVALISLLVGVADAARGRRLRGLPAWAFALLPLTAFVLQEILERSLDTGTFVWQAVESPTFVPGLALRIVSVPVLAALAGLAAGCRGSGSSGPAITVQAAHTYHLSNFRPNQQVIPGRSTSVS